MTHVPASDTITTEHAYLYTCICLLVSHLTWYRVDRQMTCALSVKHA